MPEDSATRGADRGTARQERARIETSAGGVIVRRQGGEPHVLLIRDPYANWGLPKGHLEPQETPAEAAAREVAEETGLTGLSILGPLPTIDWYFRDRGQLVHKFCHFFLMESVAGEPTPQADEGISACVWLPVRDAIRSVTYATAREVLRIASERLDAASEPTS